MLASSLMRDASSVRNLPTDASYEMVRSQRIIRGPSAGGGERPGQEQAGNTDESREKNYGCSNRAGGSGRRWPG
jgi:hypothetical protein